MSEQRAHRQGKLEDSLKSVGFRAGLNDLLDAGRCREMQGQAVDLSWPRHYEGHRKTKEKKHSSACSST